MAIQNKIISFWKQVKLKSSDMFTQFRVGVGVKVPTHKLHVKDSADPIKIEGLQNDATDPDKFLTIDSSNIVKYRTGAQVLTDIGGTPLTTEQVQDVVGAMFSSNTETRVTATYQDADGTIDLVVDDMTADTNTNIANTDLTATGNRILNLDGYNLTFSSIGDFNVGSQASPLGEISFHGQVFNIKSSTGAPDFRIFENSDNGTNYAKFTFGALGANRTYTLPDATGTVALTSDIPTGNSIIDWTQASAGTIHTSNYTDTNTNIANTDLTVTGSRTLNMDGDDLTFSSVAAFTVQGTSIFEGSIAITNGSSAPELKLKEPSGGGSSYGTLTVGALSSDRTYTFPDATGTVALTSSNITGTAAGLSSTLSVANGGTGRAAFSNKAVIITQDSGTDTLAAVTMFNNGELLIGGTDGPTAATLTQGNGLTITNANGGITIAVDGDIDTSGESGTVNNIGNLTGDVTSSNRATTIANDAVTYAKMQNVSATNVVLGRDSAGAGVVEEISAANLRTIINVEDGATADQTKGDIDALGIAATTAVSLTAGDKIIDGNLGLGGDDDESHYIIRQPHTDNLGGRLYIQAGAGGGTNNPGGTLLLQGGASTGNAGGGSIVFTSSAAGSSGSSANSVGVLGSINSEGNLSIEGDLTVKGNDIKDNDGTTCITFDSSGNTTVSNTLNATLTGNVTGNTSGSSGSCTGNAATATALATARAINGVDFDGSAAITVTAAGSTLSDTVTVAKGGTGQTTLTSDSVLTGNGTSGITAESNLTYDGTNLKITDSGLGAPDIIIESTSDHSSAGNLIFQKLRADDTPADGGNLGAISFSGEDTSNNTQIYGQIVGIQEETGAGTEGGKIKIVVATHDGELQDGIVIEDGDAEDEVDVTIGQGANSLTTIAGNLTTVGGIELGNASDTTLARSAAGTVTIEEKEIITKNKVLNIHSYAYHYSGTLGHYIPMSGATTSDSTGITSSSYHLMQVMPFDGRVVRIAVYNQSATSRTDKFEMYIDGDDSDLVGDQRGTDLSFTSAQTGSGDCATDWTFSKEEAIAIRRTPSAAVNGTTVTVVFEFDMTT